MIVVIGAGLAGLAAARTLEAHGRRALVLEARDRIGGRVYVDRSLGSPLDLGASWIHGTEGNPIAELAAQCGVRTTATPPEGAAIFADARVAPERVAESRARFLRLLERAGSIAHAAPADLSLAEALERAAPGHDDDVAFWSRWLGLVMGTPLGALSARHWTQDIDLPGPDVLVEPSYEPIVAHLARGLDVRRRHEVHAIRVGARGVTIEGSFGALESERAIVTLPLGVLKADLVRFDPPLPDEKRAAIARVGFGNLDKVAMRFAKRAWPASECFLAPLAPGPITGFVDRAPILIGMTAADLGACDEREVVALALETLRAMFGSAFPSPDATVITRWRADRHARGGYAHLPVGATGEDFDALAAPVGERLLFAGEHTHRQHPCTTHGAYLSGVREALRIVCNSS